MTYGLFDEDAAWVALPISVAFAIGLVWLLRRMRTGREERIALDPSVAPRRAEGRGPPTEGT